MGQTTRISDGDNQTTLAKLGAGTSTNALRTTSASDDPAVATLGTTTDAKVVTDASGTIQQYLRGLVTFYANALGAGTAAAAERVTLASDDPAVATLGATSGAKVQADSNGTLQQYLRGIVTWIAAWIGAGTAATAIRVVQSTDDTIHGALTEAAPATDTASSGINGRLQRIAQRLTTLISPGLGVRVSITRPSDTTTYGANDVVGVTGGGTGCIDFNLGAISGSVIKIQSASLEVDRTALIASEASYTLHLYSATAPSGLADNAAFDIPSGDRATYLGKIVLGTPVDEGSTCIVVVDNLNKLVRLSGTHIFGYLVTAGAYQPTSAAVHVLNLLAEQW